MTLPDDIQALTVQLQRVAARHGLARLQLTISPGAGGEGTDRISMHIEHSLGDILGTETSVTYYGLEAKSDAKEVNERVAEGVKRLTDVWAKCAVAEEITLNSAEKELAVCKENVELASRLDPGVLDQIVIALEETEAD